MKFKIIFLILPILIISNCSSIQRVFCKIFSQNHLNKQFISAVNKSNVYEMESLYKKGADLNSIDTRGYRPIMIAIEKQDVDSVKLLLKLGDKLKWKEVEILLPSIKPKKSEEKVSSQKIGRPL